MSFAVCHRALAKTVYCYKLNQNFELQFIKNVNINEGTTTSDTDKNRDFFVVLNNKLIRNPKPIINKGNRSDPPPP